MGYYDYTDEFRELISNTETIINNQEEIMIQNTEITNLNSIILFAIVLYTTTTLVRRLFNKR